MNGNRARTSLILSLCLGLPLPSAFAATAGKVGFQGLIKDNLGDPITGTVDLEFRLYDAESGGSLVDMNGDGVAEPVGDSTILLGVSVNGGILSTEFGPVSPKASDGNPRWLEVTVDGVPMSRLKIATAPAVAEQVNKPASGVPAISVDDTGKVGIGTDLPTAKVHVQNCDADAQMVIESCVVSGKSEIILLPGSGMPGKMTKDPTTGRLTLDAGEDLELKTDDVGTTSFKKGAEEVMKIDSTGNVGVGTSTPLSKLHVKDSSPVGAELRVESDVAGGKAEVTLMPAGGMPGKLSKDPTTGKLTLDAGEDLELKTDGVGTMSFKKGAEEIMKIDSTGKVGVGTSTPLTKLHVRDSAPTAELLVESDAPGGKAEVTLMHVGGTPGKLSKDSATGMLTLDAGDDDVEIKAGDTGTVAIKKGATDVVKVDASGNVGIGTDPAPGKKLEVAGDAKVGGDVDTTGKVTADQVDAGTKITVGLAAPNTFGPTTSLEITPDSISKTDGTALTIDAELSFAPTSDCCTEHPGPGCDNPTCQTDVCSMFPDCCDNWLPHCADFASNQVCLDICGPKDLEITGAMRVGDEVASTGDTLQLSAGTDPALRLEKTASGEPNLVGGHVVNSVDDGADGATIGGGGKVGEPNRVTDKGGTVGGGANNRAGDDNGDPATAEHATVAGGKSNTAGGAKSTVAGGEQNTASASHAAVPGGFKNEATGAYSLAAGQRAKAMHSGTFVWSDNTATDVTPFESTADNQFIVKASGGVGIGKNNPTEALDVEGNVKASGTLKIGTNSILIDGDAGTIINDSGSSIDFVSENLYTNGSVGIGTTTPTDKLHVLGGNVKFEGSGTHQAWFVGDDTGDVALAISNGGGNHYIFDDDSDNHTLKIESAGNRDLAFGTSGPNEKMRITASGNVGVGTDSPGASLHVGDGTLWVDSYVSSPEIRGRHANGSIGAPTAVTTDDDLALFWGSGHDGTGFSGPEAAIEFTAAEPWSIGAHGTYMSFFTTTAGSTSTPERMRIDPNGNIGIGTSSPNANLEVFGDRLRLVDSSSNAHLQVASSVSNMWTLRAGTDGDLDFHKSTYDGTAYGAGGSDVLTLQGDGNVGIGTTSPTGKLHVVGTAADSTVVLPNDSISVDELYNDPGIASSSQASTTTLTGAVQTILLRSIAAPSDGWVVAIGSCDVVIASDEFQQLTTVDVGVSSSSSSIPIDADMTVSRRADGSATTSIPAASQITFPVTAGTHTFYLLADEQAGNASVRDPSLTLMFFAEGYGLITANAPEPGDPASGDLATDEGHRVEYDPEAIRRELLALRGEMKSRVEYMERLMATLDESMVSEGE